MIILKLLVYYLKILRCLQGQINCICLYYSEVLGWVPMWGEFPDDLIEDYLEAYGLLVEDLEVMYGAYREDNQNCKIVQEIWDIKIYYLYLPNPLYFH